MYNKIINPVTNRKVNISYKLDIICMECSSILHKIEKFI